MTDPRSSRRHGHGGSTKHSAEFAAKSEYGDVFGGVAGSCSIPFLDLPPHPDVCDEMGPVDYAEIFGGFGGSDFAVDYEELFGKKNKKKKNNSNGRRILKETDVGRQANDTSDVHGEGAWGGRNHFPPNSEHSDDGSRQFRMSFHKTNHRSIEDIVSGTTDVTHLHAVTGYTDMIDSFSPLHGTETDNPPKVVKNDRIHIASSYRGLPDENQVNITFRGDCEKSFGAELKTQQKQFTNRYPTGEDAPANVRYHSCSSSNHSSSSGDVSLPDVAFVTISDINLRTEPSRVPPPSRAPPKLVGKQGQPKMNIYGSFKADLEEGSLPKTMGNRQTHYSLGVSKSHLINKGVKDGSPCFFDVEVDASSAAAASAAAMKEAMEQAQARLKSAKELMERKRENVQSRKKMGQQEVMKCDERPEDKTVEKVKCLSEVRTQKTLVEEEGSKKQFSFKERENVIGTAKEGTTDVKERYFVSSGEDQELMQGSGFKTTPSVPHKLETPGVWKMDKEFYELVKSENNSKMVKEVHKQEGFEKNQKIATKVNEYNENDVKQAELSCEFGRNGRLHKVEETSDRKADDNFIYGNMAVYEKIREIPNTILKASTVIENVNKFQEVHDSLQRRGNGKELPVQDAHVSEHEPERSNAIKGCAAGDYASRENKKSAEPCSTSFEFDRDTRGEEKERKLEVAEEPCGCDNNEKELVGASVSGVTLETKKRQNKVSGAGMQAQSHMFEILEQLEAVDEAYQCESHQKTRRDNKSAYCHEESRYKFDDTTSVLEEEIQRLNRTEKSGFCLQQSQVVEGTNQCEADLVKLEAVQGSFEQRECEETTNLTEEVGLQGSVEITAREFKEEIHPDEKQQKAAQALWEKGNCEEARISEGLKERVTEKIGGGVHMSSDFEEMHEVSVAGQDECQRAVDNEAEDIQQASLLEEKAKIQNFNPDDIELCPVNLQSSAQDNIQQASLLEEKANIQNSVPDDIELCPVNLRSSAQDNIDTRQINSQSPAQVGKENHHTVLTENAMPDMHKPEEREHVRRNENEQEKEQARNLDEEKEREREREKDRLAVERATREAHERALTEARERAERIAVERITEEARQRAMAEAREKSEKASAEALEKSLAEKASKEAKLKAERAAVERATAEARERAVEKALAEKAASDARQHAEKFSATSRDSRGNDREDSEINPKPSFAGMQNVPCDARFRSASSSSSLKNTDFHFQGDGDSPLRCKARLERHQRTVERAAKALAEKNVRDILAQREQAERNRLAESLDADVRRWSTGKEGNLRALLSTLQYILGPDSGWQPIPLTDVITAVGVKKAYRKATLCVHPDKLQQRGASIRQKYICEKVFDLLKEAWNRFNSEER